MKSTKQFDLYITEILNSPLFFGMDNDNIENFFSNIDFTILELSKGEAIPTELLDCAFVLKGVVCSFENTRDGKKKYINSFNAVDNQCLMVTHKNIYNTLSIEATQHSVVMIINKDYFTKPIPTIFIEQNIFEQNMIKSWIRVTEVVVERSIITSEPDATARIKKFFLQQMELQGTNKLNIKHSRDDLASYLRMDTSTLLRVLKNLKDEDYIDYNAKVFILNDKFINEYKNKNLL